MSDIALKQVHFEGITMQIPEVWDYETEVYDEADGTKSYSLSISAKGKDIRSIDISWGVIPEGSDAYTEEGCPCFFFCVGIPSKGSNNLLTVLCSAVNNEELQSLIDFVEEYLSVE